jgi:hypothetical protein
MNECIDSTMGRIHVCFAVLLASDDPRTSWFFQLVAGLVFSSLGAMQKVERAEEATCCARVSNSLLQTRCTWATGDIIPLEA